MDKPATAQSVTTTNNGDKKDFICGVIEGFYGRPWTTEQRKDLFRKLKKWGMNSYVYAPKDDYKHRAYWRELYSVEEADHLSSLIAAAKEHNVMFYYALSPGLDMTYSNQKEIQILKRKLDQVSQFGCEAFALLFDDIESELSKADKEVFQTFANAQVSVTNEIYTHLGNPRFLFCPTQYCTTRAVPNIHDSEYLNTLGSKLNQGIEIMWTGNKVISKTITIESIQEITETLRRPPVIWDNLHANDYDQKRVFLGPYSGRSPELIPFLRGVMTNPNCEYHANNIAIHTLASWSHCSMDSKVNSSISADIKLETENEDGTSTEDLPTVCCLSKKVYHPRVALKNAIAEWLPEFFIAKEAWGPITKPQPQVEMVMPVIPIIPSINTCMSLTTTTTTCTNSKTTIASTAVPEVNTTQLQALADICSTVNSSSVNPISNPVMNSLVSPTKVITNDDIYNPIPSNAASNIELPKKIPISAVAVPIMCTKELGGDFAAVEVSKAVAAATEELISGIGKEIITTGFINNDEKDVEVEEGTETAEKIIPQIHDESCAEECFANKLQDVIVSEIETEDIAIDEKPQKTFSNDNIHMLEENNLSPLSTGNEPMECSSSLNSQTSPKDERKTAVSEDVVMIETASINNSMQVESSEASPLSNAEMRDDVDDKAVSTDNKIDMDDLYLLCDLFYLPFEHGNRGCKLLSEFNWLKANANVLVGGNGGSGGSETRKSEVGPKPEVAEWLQRAEVFSSLCNSVQVLLQKIATCANKEICHDLFSYVWDVAHALTLLNAFVKWLHLRHFPHNVYTFTQGSYTWFSKGWKEAFMSGDQEPWVFRGGLIADLQRLVPVDSGNDLFLYKLPELPTSEYLILRPFMPIDETEVNQICTRALYSQNEILDHEIPELPEHLRDIISNSRIAPFITLSPELCIVAQDSSNAIVGYAAAAMDINVFQRNMEVCWIPAMQEKYTKSIMESNTVTESPASMKIHEILTAMIEEFHSYKYQCPTDVSTSHPAIITAAVLNNTSTQDHGIEKRLLTVILAALRANGCFGVHVRLAANEIEQVQYYIKIGFTEIYRDVITKHVYLGRRF